MNDLIRRQRALEKITKRFMGKSFVWGEKDCLRMVRSHLVAMGHRGLPKVPRYRSAITAKRALLNTGHDSLEALLDSILPRITPAAMLPGDIAIVRGTDEFDAAMIHLGSKSMGWHESAQGAVPIMLHEVKAAFRA